MLQSRGGSPQHLEWASGFFSELHLQIELLQKGKKGAHEKFHNATGLFRVGFDPAYLGVVVVVVNGEGKVNKAFWFGISLLMMEAVTVSATLIFFNHLTLLIGPNDVIDREM